MAHVLDVAFDYESYQYRTPIKFGGVVLDRVTLLNVEMTIDTARGLVGVGFGSMPLGNVWAFPSKHLDYETTLDAMKRLANRIAKIYRECKTRSHPIALTHQLEAEFHAAAHAVAVELKLAEPIPPLATAVVASAFDAALHDAYGKAHEMSVYHCYTKDFLWHDLGYFLGDEFAGLRLHEFVSPEPVSSLPLYHLVGALDALTTADVVQPVGDGLPDTLAEWIARDGLTHLKIKLNGDDLGWDVERVVRVGAVAHEASQSRGEIAWHYSLDFNERCQNVEYLLEFLRELQHRAPRVFEQVQYIEQPTARDLHANPANRMHAAAAIKPIVIDESLLNLETLQLARDLGYTGVAFKACKGQSQSLLLAAAAQKFGLFRCVQDLTCVGASLIHSAGLAAHIPGVCAIESNGRQYCPAANVGWDERFPGMFIVRDGRLPTGKLTGHGLGATRSVSTS